MRTDSIRFRLTAWYAGLLTLVVLGLAALLFLRLKSYLENDLWQIQAVRARQIASTLVAGADRTGEPYVAASVEALYAPSKSDRFIRITRGDGSVIYISGPPTNRLFDPAAVRPERPAGTAEARRLEPVAGQPPLLIVEVPVTTPKETRYLVEVGTSAEPVENLFHHLLVLLGLGLPLVVVLAASGGYLLVRRALRPVDEISGKAEEITQHNLSERLPVASTGDELERLSRSLNHMITRLEDAFRNSQRFVGDASHELRTPLTILRGELEHVAGDPGVPLEQRERLGSVLEEVERLSQIVERLVTLSRLDAGEAQAEGVLFDLAQLTTATADQMSLLADDRQVVVRCEASAPVFVEGDRARLKQVVVNLLDNAIKYTPSGGTVTLRVAESGRHAVLEVADTGVGIEPEALPRVFDRFFRSNQTRADYPEGSGLGLAIVKSICQAHRGAVEAESSPGKGSVFRVRLPLAAAKP